MIRDLTPLMDNIRAKVKTEMPEATVDIRAFIFNDLQEGPVGNWVRGRLILGEYTFGFAALAMTDKVPDIINRGIAALREKKAGAV